MTIWCRNRSPISLDTKEEQASIGSGFVTDARSILAKLTYTVSLLFRLLLDDLVVLGWQLQALLLVHASFQMDLLPLQLSVGCHPLGSQSARVGHLKIKISRSESFEPSAYSTSCQRLR